MRIAALWARARAITLPARVKRHVPLVLALSPALWLAVRAAREIPLSHDHPTHLFKAWHFWSEMLASGRLHGWSRYWAFGAPFGELVPSGGEAWVALFRVATLAQLSWERTYGLAFGGFLVLQSLATFVFTRRYFGAAAAAVSAWITLLDPGGLLEGGWTWHTEWGVWPVTLAVSFMLLGLERLEQVLVERRVRDVALAGAWFAASLLTHPLVIVLLPIAVLWLFLDQRVRAQPPQGGRYAAALGALVFGAALSASFLVPFLARSAEAQALGAIGVPLADMGLRLVELEVFQNVWRPLHGLALIGAWLALRGRRPGAIYLAGCGALLVLMSSDIWINTLQLERALPALTKIENNRMLLGAKLFWFPLAGYGLVALARHVHERATRATRWQRLALLAPALIALPLIVWGARHLYATQIEKHFAAAQALPEWKDLESFIAWSSGQQREGVEPDRIAYLFHRDEQHNDLLATVLPVFNHTPMYKIGYTPAQIFKRLPTTDEDELLRTLGVRYLLTSYRQNRPSLKLERRFGAFFLYRFLPYDPAPFTVLGPGRGQLLELGPERLRIQLTGTSAETRLKLHVASFPRWRARLNGADLPITVVPVTGADYPVLMEVPAHDGELVLEYVYRGADWLGLLVSLGAVPAFILVLYVERRRAPVARALALIERWRRPIWLGALATCVALVVLLALRLRTREHLLPRSSLFHQLDGAEIELAGQRCSKLGPLSFRCGGHKLRAEAVPSVVWGLPLCMTAPTDAGPLIIRARETLGSFIAVNYDATRRAGTGSIRVAAGGNDLGTVRTRSAVERQQLLAFDTRALRGRDEPIELTVEGDALRCFDFSIAP
ncbi:MAG: hypothetical protein ABW217_00395 [Polyangiaceae bacterium]